MCLWIQSALHHQCQWSRSSHISHSSLENGSCGNRNRNLTTATNDSLGFATQRNKHLNKGRGPLVNTIPSLSFPIYLRKPVLWHPAQSAYNSIFFKSPYSVCMFLAWQNSFTSFIKLGYLVSNWGSKSIYNVMCLH